MISVGNLTSSPSSVSLSNGPSVLTRSRGAVGTELAAEAIDFSLPAKRDTKSVKAYPVLVGARAEAGTIEDCFYCER